MGCDIIFCFLHHNYKCLAPWSVFSCPVPNQSLSLVYYYPVRGLYKLEHIGTEGLETKSLLIYVGLDITSELLITMQLHL